MKKCTLCKEEKPLTEFNKKHTTKDGLQNICKLCSRERSKRYYRENKEKHLAVIYKNRKKYVARNRKYAWNWLETHPCVDCGETDIVVLEFDHKDGSDKKGEISLALRDQWSFIRLKKEIDKCEVRCANCHRRRTAKQYNWNILNHNR